MIESESQVRRFYSEIWGKRNYEEIPKLLLPDFRFRGSLGKEEHGHDGFRDYVEYVHGALSHYECIIEDIVVQSDAVFAKMLFSGIHSGEFMGYTPSHQKLSWAGAALFKFSDNKISSVWVLGDLKGLEQKLENEP